MSIGESGATQEGTPSLRAGKIKIKGKAGRSQAAASVDLAAIWSDSMVEVSRVETERSPTCIINIFYLVSISCSLLVNLTYIVVYKFVIWQSYVICKFVIWQSCVICKFVGGQIGP
jgi:hypothetical protein